MLVNLNVVMVVDVVDVDMDVAVVADVSGVLVVGVDVDDGKRSQLDDRAA